MTVVESAERRRERHRRGARGHAPRVGQDSGRLAVVLGRRGEARRRREGDGLGGTGGHRGRLVVGRIVGVPVDVQDEVDASRGLPRVDGQGGVDPDGNEGVVGPRLPGAVVDRGSGRQCLALRKEAEVPARRPPGDREAHGDGAGRGRRAAHAGHREVAGRRRGEGGTVRRRPGVGDAAGSHRVEGVGGPGPGRREHDRGEPGETGGGVKQEWPHAGRVPEKPLPRGDLDHASGPRAPTPAEP